MANYWS